MKKPVQKFDANTKGRDFVVGDMHGFYDLFLAELDRYDFDPSCDRVFSVGVLIDKGPKSLDCLRLLKCPWFHSVRGNHEQMLLDFCFPYSLSEQDRDLNAKIFLKNGGDWVNKLEATDHDEFWYELLPLAQALPHLICVGHGSHRFNVAHAELVAEVDEFPVNALKATSTTKPSESSRVLTNADIDHQIGARFATANEGMLWGRSLLKSSSRATGIICETPYGEMMVSQNPWRDNLSMTYVGHTPVRTMVFHQSHLFIDRGAFMQKADFCLLMVCHQKMVSVLEAFKKAEVIW